MIVRPRPSTLGLFFVLRGSIIPHILGRILVITAISFVVVGMYHQGWFSPAHLSAVPFSLFGLALSVFMGFRNNVCYDRWWEARKLWGELIVQSRNLARESAAVLGAGHEARVRIARRSVGFAYALAARLRDHDMAAAAGPWLPPEEARALVDYRNVPDGILTAINRELAGCLARGEIGEIIYQGLTQRVAACAGVQAACERIRLTPTPYAYSLLLHRTAWLFCLLLPFGLVGTLEYLTPIAVTFVAYTFFGLDALGDELEDPFGEEENDLPLAALARTIEIDLLEGMGVQPLPEPARPRDYVLR